jgi:hypothetical protein
VIGPPLAGVLPNASLVARRTGSRPLFEWLYQLDGGEGDGRVPGPVVVRTRWRGGEGSAVLHRFARGRPRAGSPP